LSLCVVLTQCEAYSQVREAGLSPYGWLSGKYRALQIGHCKSVDCHSLPFLAATLCWGVI